MSDFEKTSPEDGCDCGDAQQSAVGLKPFSECETVAGAAASCCESTPSGGCDDDVSCCGAKLYRSGELERPGYLLQSYTADFMETPVGPVPRVKSRWECEDTWNMIRVRIGIGRDRYIVAPGLYCVGSPEPDAPVLVTANFKLSFDLLRRQLDGLDVWLLVLDTRGVNVWCAAGKDLFATHEVVRRIQDSRLAEVVTHRRIILPQLGAPGVSAQEVRRQSGFKVIWGPVRAEDVKPFLAGDCKAEPDMRRVTFTLRERAAVIPVEIYHLKKYVLCMALLLFVLSGIGGHIFSIHAGWTRGLPAATAVLTGVFAGTVVVPLLLPWIPGRAFAVKGGIVGVLAGIAAALSMGLPLLSLSGVAVLSAVFGLSSFFAMNFTGSTPYTSPSGVESEMRKAMPVQAAAVALAVVLWIIAGFAA